MVNENETSVFFIIKELRQGWCILKKFIDKIFSGSSFAICLNLFQSYPSLFLSGLLSPLWCLSTAINYYFEVSFDLKEIFFITKISLCFSNLVPRVFSFFKMAEMRRSWERGWCFGPVYAVIYLITVIRTCVCVIYLITVGYSSYQDLSMRYLPYNCWIQLLSGPVYALFTLSLLDTAQRCGCIFDNTQQRW